MIRGSLFLSVLILVFLSSCQKEPNVTLGNDPPTTAVGNDSIYLSEYVELDTALPSGQDTIVVERYFYDNIKRLSHLTWVEMIGSGPGSVTRPGVMTYHYHGNDTLPYKWTVVSGENGMTDVIDTVFFTYNSNGIITKDSSWTTLLTSGGRSTLYLTNYTANGNNVAINGYTRDYTTQPPIDAPFAGIANLVFSGGEIVSQTSPSSLLTGYEYFQLGYTDHPDPFYRMDAHYPLYYAYVGWGRGSAKKLLTSLDVGTSPGNIISKYRFSYEYRADGYPLVCRETDLLDPSYHAKYLYFYTRL